MTTQCILRDRELLQCHVRILAVYAGHQNLQLFEKHGAALCATKLDYYKQGRNDEQSTHLQSMQGGEEQIRNLTLL